MVQLNILNIHKRSGDTHIGQTIVRLATLASAAHRYQVAEEINQTINTHDQSVSMVDPLTNNPDLTPVVHSARKDVGQFHKEVDR